MLREATNNLNRVKFGPAVENRRFVAEIACRPEALQVDAQTRTAKATSGEHRYAANLLRVMEWPRTIWRIGTIEDAKEVNKLDRTGVDPFGCARGWVWAFADPSSSSGKRLFDLAVEDEVAEVSTESYLADRDAPAVVPQLLNRALAFRLERLGMTIRYEAGRMKAYYASLDGEARVINYRSTFKQARRTVAKPIVSRSTGKVVYWEHKAVYLRFEQFGPTWAMSLLPSYAFTLDGETKPIASERIGPLSTRRAARDYNPTVMHDLVFWSRMLSEEHDDTTFRLSLTRQAGGPAAAISSSIPSFVFQDSLDIGTFEGEEVEFSPDLGEEQEDLQERSNARWLRPRPRRAAMKIQIARLPVPELEFGGAGFFQDPRHGLAEAGPFDTRFGSAHKTQIRLSIVGTSDGVDLAATWLRKCKAAIEARSPEGSQVAFPGFDEVFRSELIVHEASNVLLDSQKLEKALGLQAL